MKWYVPPAAFVFGTVLVGLPSTVTVAASGAGVTVVQTVPGGAGGDVKGQVISLTAKELSFTSTLLSDNVVPEGMGLPD